MCKLEILLRYNEYLSFFMTRREENMKEYLKNVEEVIQEQETSRDLGLSIKEVEKRQVTFGKNKLKEGKRHP